MADDRRTWGSDIPPRAPRPSGPDWRSPCGPDRSDGERRTARGTIIGLSVCLTPVVVLSLLAAAGDLFDFSIDPARQACAGSSSDLVQATTERGAAEVGRILDEEADPNAPDDESNRPLPCAAMVGNAAAVDRLLAAGADPNLAGKAGGRPIVAAISGEGLGVATSGANEVNDGRSGEPFFARLESHQRIDILHSLLEAGAEPDGAMSPAVVSNNRQALEVLLAAGASPDGEPTEPSPLMTAAFLGKEPLVERLLAAGADPDNGGRLSYYELFLYTTFGGANDLSGYEQEPRVVSRTTLPDDIRDRLPCSGEVPPLVAAAYTGRVEIVRWLLGAGADPNALAFDTIPPLYAALSWPEVAQVLRAAGAIEDRPRPLPPPPPDEELESGEIGCIGD